MKHILIALCFVCSIASAEIISLGDGRYVDLPVMDRAQMEQKLQEKKDALHNAQVLAQRQIDAISKDIIDTQALIDATPTKPEVLVDENAYPDLNSGSGINF